MIITAAPAVAQSTPAGSHAFQQVMEPVHRTLLNPDASPSDRFDAMTGYVPADEILIAQVYLDRLLDGLDEVRDLGLEHGTRLLDYILAAHIATALESIPDSF
ncbi:hypothetical protein LG293_16745 (plasmid) [Citricoccus nitrophenolicus]